MAKKKKEVVEEQVVPQVEEQVIEQEVETTAEEVTAEEEAVAEPEVEKQEEVVDDVEPEKVIEEFTDKAKQIDEFVTNDTTQEELQNKLEEELAHAEETMEKLEKHVADLEKQAKPKPQNTSFARFWMGSSDGWFN